PQELSAAPGPARLWGAVLSMILEQYTREPTVQEGDEVTFQCIMKGGVMSYYFMYWYRQGQRGTLEWIYMEGDIYGEGFQDCIKGLVEKSENRFTLQILSAKQGDAATYYCGNKLKCNGMEQIE
uniref:Ig-like domain-containing protein n=1 Tax=Malurus cyaneus samueli TaxID=2593467 RepID=A0A8C5TG81_9PASS